MTCVEMLINRAKRRAKQNKTFLFKKSKELTIGLISGFA